MPTAQIIDRIVSREASVWGSTLKRRTFTQADFVRIQGAIGRTLNRALHIRDDCHDLQTILANARALHAQKGLRVLLVDYLQIIRGPDKELREQQVAAISRELRLLALETGAVVVALCQLNRNGEARESTAITMDATQFLAIHRANTEGKRFNPTDDEEEEDKNKRILEIRKIRDGECGEVEIGFDGGCSRFYELK
jgi:replicative DNA helicase